MISSPFCLCLAHDDDLPAIVEIYNSIVPTRMVTADLEPVTVEARRSWFEAHKSHTRPLWVLRDERTNTIAGWMSFDTFYPRAAYDGTVMIAIYLAESCRGQGLGQLLLAEACLLAPERGIHTLLGYIFGHNTPSIKLFQKMGFQAWANLPRTAILDGIERDLVIMGKRVA